MVVERLINWFESGNESLIGRVMIVFGGVEEKAVPSLAKSLYRVILYAFPGELGMSRH